MNINDPDYVPDWTWEYPASKYQPPRISYRMRGILIIILGIALIALAYWLNDITTPQSCKVPIAQMSQTCKDILYP